MASVQINERGILVILHTDRLIIRLSFVGDSIENNIRYLFAKAQFVFKQKPQSTLPLVPDPLALIEVIMNGYPRGVRIVQRIGKWFFGEVVADYASTQAIVIDDFILKNLHITRGQYQNTRPLGYGLSLIHI